MLPPRLLRNHGGADANFPGWSALLRERGPVQSPASYRRSESIPAGGSFLSSLPPPPPPPPLLSAAPNPDRCAPVEFRTMGTPRPGMMCTARKRGSRTWGVRGRDPQGHPLLPFTVNQRRRGGFADGDRAGLPSKEIRGKGGPNRSRRAAPIDHFCTPPDPPRARPGSGTPPARLRWAKNARARGTQRCAEARRTGRGARGWRSAGEEGAARGRIGEGWHAGGWAPAARPAWGAPGPGLGGAAGGVRVRARQLPGSRSRPRELLGGPV